MDNPFVIKIPPGTTEFDLAPVLRPIIYAIRAEMRSHEGRCHWGNGPKKFGPIRPEEVDEALQFAIDEFHYRKILPKLTVKLVVAYLKETNWKEEGGCYKRWNYGRQVWLNSSRNNRADPYHQIDTAVHEIAGEERRSACRVAEDILAFENVLDRIVMELKND